MVPLLACKSVFKTLCPPFEMLHRAIEALDLHRQAKIVPVAGHVLYPTSSQEQIILHRCGRPTDPQVVSFLASSRKLLLRNDRNIAALDGTS